VNGGLKFEILDDYYKCRIKKWQGDLPININMTEIEKFGVAMLRLDATTYKIYDSDMLVYKKESTLIPYNFQNNPIDI
jgi:hypothetical protein